ncbi:MAG: glucose-6-phosphate dehydrogenase [Gammaproteobacteria bacterium]|nr:glucose-6-phosphate dehydrogenase [Gammaproteobacteria bacterium]MBU2435594.1 glucose-6-phosphate dehydrogenase [Gammaproteobacteria bacterium]MBU2449626.1 glucose-6-phosphate dehydrogenase [Gammaproteobacteria bacterium]
MSCASESHAYVIFGATGNLAMAKLLPALYQLHSLGHLAPEVRILGCGRTPYAQDSWRAEVGKLLQVSDSGPLDSFLQRLDYLAGNLDDAAFYQALGAWMGSSECGNNVIFYLSVSPELYVPITVGLAQAGLLAEHTGWRRMVIEKPFGHDLQSARDLQHELNTRLDEEQIYRIDHYVGKESVQNVLVLRFANMILEPLWNRHYIDQVQITHAETIGLDGRADYYDRHGGATRDMIQSHLLQVLALLAMEPPVSLEAEALRDEKVKVLRSIRPLDPSQLASHAVRAQYAGYQQEAGVTAGSHTETYAALKLYVDNWRWRDVPFYLRTGKRLKERRSMVAVRFREPPMQLFQGTGASAVHPNWLLIGIQPDDVVQMEISAKVPGQETRTRQISMDASVGNPGERMADAYEELLIDVIQGNRSLFLRYDEVKAAWNIVDPFMRGWADDEHPPLQYPAGSWGPKAADRIFGQTDREWRQTLSCNGKPEGQG